MVKFQIMNSKGYNVLTTKQIAEAYETDEKVISKNFNNNRVRYIEGKHYIRLTGNDLKVFLQSQKVRMQNESKIRVLYLWTEKGALLHAKSINTDKAWEVYDYLVDFYFRVKEEPRQQESVATPQPVSKPLTATVVDIPVNDKAQKLIRDMQTDMAGIEAVIQMYNRYMKEENYQKVAYVLRDLCVHMAELGFQVMDLKPNVIEKRM